MNTRQFLNPMVEYTNAVGVICCGHCRPNAAFAMSVICYEHFKEEIIK